MPIIDESISGNHCCYRRNQIQTDLSNRNNLNRVRINIEYAITEIKLAFPAKVGPQKEVLKFNGVQLFFVTATKHEQGLKQENSMKVRKFLWSCEKLTPAHCRKYQVLPV